MLLDWWWSLSWIAHDSRILKMFLQFISCLRKKVWGNLILLHCISVSMTYFMRIFKNWISLAFLNWSLSWGLQVKGLGSFTEDLFWLELRFLFWEWALGGCRFRTCLSLLSKRGDKKLERIRMRVELLFGYLNFIGKGHLIIVPIYIYSYPKAIP